MGMCEQAELMREKVRDSGFVLVAGRQAQRGGPSADRIAKRQPVLLGELGDHVGRHALGERRPAEDRVRSEEHTSELQSLMRISYAVFCLKKKKKNNISTTDHRQK